MLPIGHEPTSTMRYYRIIVYRLLTDCETESAQRRRGERERMQMSLLDVNSRQMVIWEGCERRDNR